MDIPDVQFDEAISRLTRVFGIHSVSPALAVDKDWQSVCSTAYMLMDKEIEKNPNFSFKVFARRSDKHYFMNSDGINRELGHLFSNATHPCVLTFTNPRFLFPLKYATEHTCIARRFPAQTECLSAPQDVQRCSFPAALTARLQVI